MSAVRWHRPALRARILAGDEPAWLLNHVRRSYVRQAVIATPPWVDVEGLKRLERERDERTKTTGIPHVLAHVVPLNHPKVCGLNVPENLKVVPWAVNAHEGNAWGGDVVEPEQLELALCVSPNRLSPKFPPAVAALSVEPFARHERTRDGCKL